MAEITKEETLTIRPGQSDSSAAHMQTADVTGIFTDAAATFTALQILVAPGGRDDPVPADAKFGPLTDSANNLCIFRLAPGTHLSIPRDLCRATGWLRLRALSDPAGHYVPQAQSVDVRTFVARGIFR